jgi:hypothetical protein
MAAAYYPDYKPHNAEKFAELEREFGVANTVEALRFRVTLYTFDMSYPREDIMVALGRVERAKGWKID